MGIPSNERLPGLSRLFSGGLAGARGLVGYLSSVMGADAYDRYCAHLAANHPDREPPTEKEFWREHMDWMEKNPQGRCC
ncbi:YbdD/YjiX family protein [Intrasporangium sp. DVR]|uniref:YbdD/YjiX family protein n=1 Tax=Intrasporangium sp. DVR TaxID=3127867 RepID=UPI00313A644A